MIKHALTTPAMQMTFIDQMIGAFVYMGILAILFTLYWFFFVRNK